MRQMNQRDAEKFINPDTGFVVIRLNKRYQNVNPGETAGYPMEEALKLLNMETEIGDKSIPVAVGVEFVPTQKAKA